MNDLTRSQYQVECRRVAEDVIREARAENRDENEVLHETIDSDNDGAYEDVMGERAPTDEARAYMAMETDVRECMERIRADVEAELDAAEVGEVQS